MPNILDKMREQDGQPTQSPFAAKDTRGPLQKTFDFIQRPMYGGIGAVQSLVEGEGGGAAAGQFWEGLAGRERPTGLELESTLQAFVNKYPEKRIPLIMPPPQYREETIGGGGIPSKVMGLPTGERASQIRALLTKTQEGRSQDVGYGTAKGFAEAGGKAFRGLLYEIGLDPLTYVPGAAIGKAVKPLTKGAAFVKTAEKVKAAPVIKEVGRLIKPFFGMADEQIKGFRKYLWGKEDKKRMFKDLVMERAEKAGLSTEQANLATHSIQYPELLEGDNPVKALDALLDKKKVESDILRQEIAALKKGTPEFAEASRNLDINKGLFETPEQELREFVESLSKESPESFTAIKEASQFGRSQFDKMLRREQAAGLPVALRERYAPGVYPKELKRLGGSPQREKTFASLLEAKSAGWEPEENMWKLIAQRGHKSISATETKLFTGDMLQKFGRKLIPDAEGKVVVKEGERIWAQRDALRNIPASDVPDWVTKRINAMKAGDDLVELRLSDVQELSRLGKKVDIHTLPESLVHWMSTYEKRIQGEGLRIVAGWNNKFMNYFRAWATMPRFAFHLRNTIDNYFRLFLDVGVDAINPALNVRAAKVLRKGSKGKVKLHGREYSFEQIRSLMEKHGLRRHGWIGGDIWDKDYSDLPRALDRMFAGKGKNMARALNPLDIEDFFMLRAGRYFGEHIEDHAHALSFMKNLDKSGDPYKAAERAHKFLIDYRELTPFERRVGKGLFPFYTFFRKNIPLQAEQIIKQPGKYALIPKGKRFVENLSEEPDYEPPEYYEKAFAVRLPITRRVKDPKTGKITERQQYANLNMSFQELNQITEIGDIIARMHPLIKAPVELFAEKEAFSGIPGTLAEEKISKAPEGMRFLPEGMRDALGIHKYRRPGGKEEWRMPAKNRYILQTLNPYLPELLKMFKDVDGFDWKRFFTGAMTTELDPEQQRRFNTYKRREQMRKMLKQSREQRAIIE